MSHDLARRALVALLGLSLVACDEASGPWPADEGRVSVAIGYHGAGSAPRDLVASGTITLRAARGERQRAFSHRLAALNGVSTAPLSLETNWGSPIGDFGFFTAPETFACDPAAGPVEVIVRVDAVSPEGAGGGVVPLAGAARTATVPCRAGWEAGASADFEVVDPRRIGEIAVDVVLVDPPAGATAGAAAVRVVPTDRDLAANPGGIYVDVPLSPDGAGRLVGRWSGRCVAAVTRRAFVEPVALTVPGRDADVWELWPPPATVTGDVACEPGRAQAVEVVLAPR
ncbi:MAG: hypothetical protein H6745_26270 [Deltaproteobacteria bacterium]|nr:hypothetical protein [Deltaproteobacteria bacterium]